MSTLTVVLAVPTVVATVVAVVGVVVGVGAGGIGAGPTVKTPFMPAAAWPDTVLR